MAITNKFYPEALKSLGFASISGSYANVGSVVANPWVEFVVSNTTDVDVIVSFDGGTTDHLRLKTGQSYTFSPGACSIPGQNNIRLPAGLQFAAKQAAGAATVGALCVTGFYTR